MENHRAHGPAMSHSISPVHVLMPPRLFPPLLWLLLLLGISNTVLMRHQHLGYLSKTSIKIKQALSIFHFNVFLLNTFLFSSDTLLLFVQLAELSIQTKCPWK